MLLLVCHSLSAAQSSRADVGSPEVACGASSWWYQTRASGRGGGGHSLRRDWTPRGGACSGPVRDVTEQGREVIVG